MQADININNHMMIILGYKHFIYLTILLVLTLSNAKILFRSLIWPKLDLVMLDQAQL